MLLCDIAPSLVDSSFSNKILLVFSVHSVTLKHIEIDGCGSKCGILSNNMTNMVS